MGFKVLPANDEDMTRLFQILSAAFHPWEPVTDVLYPNHWTPEGQANGAKRFIEMSRSEHPEAQFIKAVDETTGEIAGFAKWLFFNGRIPQDDKGLEGGYWDHDAALKEYAAWMVPTFMQKRMAAITECGGRCVSLDICCVHPSYQRKGVGHGLVEWGVRRADELGVGCVVESSPFGRGLYEKHGFVWREDVVYKPSDDPRFHDMADIKFAWMTRPQKAKA